MKIRKLQLKNIGVFDDEIIEFQECPEAKAEIHIFTGQNGSGKTTVLQSLASTFKYYPNSHKEQESLVGFNEFLSFINQMSTNNENEEKLKQAFENLYDLFQMKLYEPRKRVSKDDFSKRFRFFEFEGDLETRSFIKINDSIQSYGCPQCFNSHSEQPSIYGKLSSERQDSLVKNLKFKFAAFAYSGYRRIRDEKIELGNEFEENPLFQSLEFVKDENSKFTINQWLGRNLSKRALAKEEAKINERRFDENIKNLEKLITDIIGYEIKFKLKTDLSLILIKGNQELDFDVLPDGLKSLISWIGDLLMRLDSLKWENDIPIFNREIILFLDEIEVHLHPAWQRKVLPVVQKLFKNSQIFVSTHSPFVVNSVDDAWVYELKVENGKAQVAEKSLTKTAYSYQTVLREIFDIDKRFGLETQKKLDIFLGNSRAIFQQLEDNQISKEKFLDEAKNLASESAELQSIVFLELAKLSKKTGEKYEI